MNFRAPSTGTPWKPLIDVKAKPPWLTEFNAQVEDHRFPDELFLGGCILGWTAPVFKHTLLPNDYQLQAWLLYQRLYPNQAEALLKSAGLI